PPQSFDCSLTKRRTFAKRSQHYPFSNLPPPLGSQPLRTKLPPQLNRSTLNTITDSTSEAMMPASPTGRLT
ncbi:MAG: hypothetical protein ACTS40_01235, partial [Candidatus Hodgkinia cicadicola]